MKGYEIGTSATVTRLASVEITGNVIPLEWFNHIKRSNGKPDAIAIMLLADIVYWYRPIEVRDEKSGKVIGYRKKFQADKLQRSYGSFSDLYGFTKNQVKDALAHLAERKLIDLDFRHITINGTKYGNVLFIGLDVDQLFAITHPPLCALNPIGSTDKSGEGMGFKGDTNTETSPETSTDSLAPDGASAPPPPPDPEPEPPTKSPYIQAMEHLEQVFSEERGVPLPDWDDDPKEAQKTWRTPLGKMYKGAYRDLAITETLLLNAIKKLKKDHLTFTKPIQVLETFNSLLADRTAGTGPTLEDYNIPYIGS